MRCERIWTVNVNPGPQQGFVLSKYCQYIFLNISPCKQVIVIKCLIGNISLHCSCKSHITFKTKLGLKESLFQFNQTVGNVNYYKHQKYTNTYRPFILKLLMWCTWLCRFFHLHLTLLAWQSIHTRLRQSSWNHFIWKNSHLMIHFILMGLTVGLAASEQHLSTSFCSYTPLWCQNRTVLFNRN